MFLKNQGAQPLDPAWETPKGFALWRDQRLCLWTQPGSQTLDPFCAMLDFLR